MIFEHQQFLLMAFNLLPRPINEVPSLGGLSKGCEPVFTRVSEKTTENSERIGRQARLGFEPGTSRLPVFRAEPLGHWWVHGLEGNKVGEQKRNHACVPRLSRGPDSLFYIFIA